MCIIIIIIIIMCHVLHRSNIHNKSGYFYYKFDRFDSGTRYLQKCRFMYVRVCVDICKCVCVCCC